MRQVQYGRGGGRKGTDFLPLSDLSQAVIEANNQTENIRVMMIFIRSVKIYFQKSSPDYIWLLNISLTKKKK